MLVVDFCLISWAFWFVGFDACVGDLRYGAVGLLLLGVLV